MENLLIIKKYEKKIKIIEFKMIMSIAIAIMALLKLIMNPGVISSIALVIFIFSALYFIYERMLIHEKMSIYKNRAQMKKRVIEIIKCNRI